MGTIYAIFLPIRFVLRLLLGIWYLFARNVLPTALLRKLPRSLLPGPGPGHGLGLGLGRGDRNGDGFELTDSASIHLPHALAEMTGLPASSLPPWFNHTSPSISGVGTSLGYKPFLRHLKEEAKLGVVILTCGDHEDDEEFKRAVLADPELVACLRENEVVCWGADVREREGYQGEFSFLSRYQP